MKWHKENGLHCASYRSRCLTRARCFARCFSARPIHGLGASCAIGVGNTQLEMARARLSGSIRSSKEDAARACADGFKWGPSEIGELGGAPASACCAALPFCREPVSEKEQVAAVGAVKSAPSWTQDHTRRGWGVLGAVGAPPHLLPGHPQAFLPLQAHGFLLQPPASGALIMCDQNHTSVWREELGPEGIEVANHLNY